MDRLFEPWIGKKYWSEGLSGIRVLVLGESHYGEIGTEYPEVTRDVVRELGQTFRCRFFTVAQKLVLRLGADDWLTDSDRQGFWERVSFYNFIQGYVGDSARIRPSHYMWIDSAPPFLITIEELKPNILFVLGKELFSNLPDIPKEIQVCAVQHPSSAVRYETYQPIVRDVFRSCERKIYQAGSVLLRSPED